MFALGGETGGTDRVDDGSSSGITGNNTIGCDGGGAHALISQVKGVAVQKLGDCEIRGCESHGWNNVKSFTIEVGVGWVIGRPIE